MRVSVIALGRSPARLVAAVCAAQVLVQIGAFFWPALLPGMMSLWQLSNTEAGWNELEERDGRAVARIHDLHALQIGARALGHVAHERRRGPRRGGVPDELDVDLSGRFVDERHGQGFSASQGRQTHGQRVARPKHL